ncbi:MAG: L,D-transpeptidase [Bacteroidales bacterium]|nr:L,D-transpeptidase [Bacteroidales bacterium]
MSVSCVRKTKTDDKPAVIAPAPLKETIKVLTVDDILIEKDFTYDKYTLDDVYPYKDKTREFQWDKIKENLVLLENFQNKPAVWGVLQNRHDVNGRPPLTAEYQTNEYKEITDMYGIQQYEGIPLYLDKNTKIPERYGDDGTLVKIISNDEDSLNVSTLFFEGDWIVPSKYVHIIPDTMTFSRVVFVDRTNQNIATLEKVDTKWLVRSMNPATTGLHKPPLMYPTPLGIFVIQEKKPEMHYYVDGTTEIGGYAPYASRFSNGGYIHGVPVNLPATEMIEYGSTLGTTPRSHMCVRNATSHAKFVYEWGILYHCLVFVID